MSIGIEKMNTIHTVRKYHTHDILPLFKDRDL